LVQQNPSLARLKSRYLFAEIASRKCQFLATHPDARLISLGIGDTTEPIPASITESLVETSLGMGTQKGYVGYGPEQGIDPLRKQIASVLYGNRFDHSEIFVSDGACCDIGRLQALFGSGVRIAVQDPAYPAYSDGSIIHGVQAIYPMPCRPEDDFFPDMSALPPVDILYMCSPNNPTGSVLSHAHLEKIVSFAKRNRSVIVFDTAYAAYIRDQGLPKSIYEIPGAEEVAIEIGSFSKSAGFTGVRLGWTVVPRSLTYDCGRSIRDDWDRIVTTLFNGASIISQRGGITSLTDQGAKEAKAVVDSYLENARLIKGAFERKGYEVFGGVHAPYLWVRFPGRDSWDVFQELLEKAHIVSVPGSGFGRCGEGFMRFSAYGKREHIVCAVERLASLL
jgi:LL-diaminopimelate aminotransferase